jgi:hypothetical protein
LSCSALVIAAWNKTESLLLFFSVRAAGDTTSAVARAAIKCVNATVIPPDLLLCVAMLAADGTTTATAGAVSADECVNVTVIPPDLLEPLLELANTPGQCAALAAALEAAGLANATVFLDEVCMLCSTEHT